MHESTPATGMTQWDVFSSRALEGNSLAVFVDGRGLSDSEMQSLAKERVLIEQCAEVKRPSRIFVRASRTDNRIVNVRVGGNLVEFMRGEVFL